MITTDVRRVDQLCYSDHRRQPWCHSQWPLNENTLAEAETRILDKLRLYTCMTAPQTLLYFLRHDKYKERDTRVESGLSCG